MIKIFNQTLSSTEAPIPQQVQITTFVTTTENQVLLASAKGSLLSLSLPTLHTDKDEIPLTDNSPISQLLQLSKNFVVSLANGQVSIFDLATLGLTETLPFGNVFMVDVLLEGDNKSILVLLTKNNQIILYEFNDSSNSLEMIKQVRISDKLNYIKLIQCDEVIYSTKSGSFHSLRFNLKPSTANDDFNGITDTILSELGRSGLFSYQNIDIVKKPTIDGHELLLSKGIHAIKLDQDNKVIQDQIHWEHTPKEVIFFDPFLLLITANHIHIKDFKSLVTLQVLEIPKIQQVIPIGDSLIVISQFGIFKYDKLAIDSILNQLEIPNAIELLKELKDDQISNKFLKLRELEVLNALSQLHDATPSGLKRILDTFSNFICPPFIVISLFPEALTGLNKTSISIPKRQSLAPSSSSSKTSNKSNENKVTEIKTDQRSIHLLTFYITDIRRKLDKVLRSENKRIPLDDNQGLLTLDLFTNDDLHSLTSTPPSTPPSEEDDKANHYSSSLPHSQHTLQEIQTLLDTTLFQCYAEINPGLIGSLVRLDNHCDVNLVEKTLKSKGLINELIDFYFKKNHHEKALGLLWSLIVEKNHEHPEPKVEEGEESDKTDRNNGIAYYKKDKESDIEELKGKSDPVLLVKYLQRLTNDHIGLILQYTKLLITIDLNYGIEVLINSTYSDSFDRLKIWKFLNTGNAQIENIEFLERMYLEYIIIELKEGAVFYNTRLAEIYLSNLTADQCEVNSIHYKKLYGFLQNGKFDLNNVLKKINDLSNKNNHILLLKTFVLSRLEKHGDVLKIYVNQIGDSSLAIHYLSKIFTDHGDQVGEKYYLKLVGIFWSNGEDKESILKLLINSKYSSKISVVKIIKSLPPSQGKEPAFKVQELERFLIKNLRIQKTKSNLTNLKKTLLELSNIKNEEVFLDLSNFKVNVLKEEERCFICDGLLGNSVINCVPLHSSSHDFDSSHVEKGLDDINIDQLRELGGINGKIFEDVKNDKKYVLVHFGCTKKLYKLTEKLEKSKIKLTSMKLKDYVALRG